MAIADYQNALLRLQGTPSSVRAISRFDEPLIDTASTIGRDVVSQRNISSGIARQRELGELDKSIQRAQKEEYKAAVPMELFGAGAEWQRTKAKKAKDIQREKEEIRAQRRYNALLKALTGYTEDMIGVYANPSALPSPYIYNQPTVTPNTMSGAISSKIGGNYGRGGY